MQEYFIIGDIAGEYDTLMRLVSYAPEKAIIVSVSDIVDHGPKSADVINEFMTNPRFKVVLGNHDHMMWNNLANLNYYPNDVWYWNGGTKTIESYESKGLDLLTKDENSEDWKKKQEIITFLSGLPLYIQDKDAGLFVSHSFPNPSMPLDVTCDLARWGENYSQVEMSIIWNCGKPRRMKDFYQVAGHNSHWGLKRFFDADGEYGICIDTSRPKILTALHRPSQAIYQQEYV